MFGIRNFCKNGSIHTTKIHLTRFDKKYYRVWNHIELINTMNKLTKSTISFISYFRIERTLSHSIFVRDPVFTGREHFFSDRSVKKILKRYQFWDDLIYDHQEYIKTLRNGTLQLRLTEFDFSKLHGLLLVDGFLSYKTKINKNK